MLPFIAGIAAGAAVVVAVNNRKAIKAKVLKGAEKAKAAAESGFEKSKALAGDVKKSVGKKVDRRKKGAKEAPSGDEEGTATAAS